MTRTPARVIQEPRCLSKARTYDPLIKSHYIRADFARYSYKLGRNRRK